MTNNLGPLQVRFVFILGPEENIEEWFMLYQAYIDKVPVGVQERITLSQTTSHKGSRKLRRKVYV